MSRLFALAWLALVILLLALWQARRHTAHFDWRWTDATPGDRETVRAMADDDWPLGV